MRRALPLLLCLVAASTLLAGCSSQQARLEESLAAVCLGQAVAEAAAYEGDGPHPVVLLSDSGEHHTWSGQLDDAWLAGSLADVQLVACVGDQTRQSIEVCHYNGPDITRYMYQVSARIVEAQTGRTVATRTIAGDPPRDCRSTEDYDLTVLEGTEVEFDAVRGWASNYVLGTAAE